MGGGLNPPCPSHSAGPAQEQAQDHELDLSHHEYNLIEQEVKLFLSLVLALVLALTFSHLQKGNTKLKTKECS